MPKPVIWRIKFGAAQNQLAAPLKCAPAKNHARITSTRWFIIFDNRAGKLIRRELKHKIRYIGRLIRKSNIVKPQKIP